MNRITPSKPDYWAGTPQESSEWTVEQERAINAENDRRVVRGKRAAIPVYAVKLRVEVRVGGFMGYTKIENRTVRCPMLAITKTGRLVITPSGMPKWINREGFNA